MHFLNSEGTTSVLDIDSSPPASSLSLPRKGAPGAIEIHESGASWTDPALQPIKERRDLVDTKTWANYKTRVDRMEQLGGTIYQIEGDRALIEFTRGGESILRSIDVSELKRIGAREVRVGDKIALISTHTGNTAQSQLRYLGSGLHRLNPVDSDRLDDLRKDGRQRGR